MRNAYENYNKHYYMQLLRSISIFVASAAMAAIANAGSVSLAWNANTESNLAGYHVKYGTASGNYTQVYDAGATPAATVPNLTVGATYFFVVTAYSASGTESGPSNQVSGVAGTGVIPPLNGHALVNVSTRSYVQTGEDVLIGGVIIEGTASKKVVLRGIGPSLAAGGVKGALADPMLSLHDSTGAEIASNDNWKSNADVVQATGLAPSDDRESAIVTTLAPGAYTVVMSGVGNTEGVALFELYDLEPTNSHIGNIATRGLVEDGDDIMIAGFIVGGNQPSKVLVRALGPSLVARGIKNALADPALELYNGQGSRIFANDSWRASQAQQITASLMPPENDRESAIIATLPPGNYTAMMRGVGGATGVGLIEVYNMSP